MSWWIICVVCVKIEHTLCLVDFEILQIKEIIAKEISDFEERIPLMWREGKLEELDTVQKKVCIE